MWLAGCTIMAPDTPASCKYTQTGHDQGPHFSWRHQGCGCYMGVAVRAVGWLGNLEPDTAAPCKALKPAGMCSMHDGVCRCAVQGFESWVDPH